MACGTACARRLGVCRWRAGHPANQGSTSADREPDILHDGPARGHGGPGGLRTKARHFADGVLENLRTKARHLPMVCGTGFAPRPCWCRGEGRPACEVREQLRLSGRDGLPGRGGGADERGGTRCTCLGVGKCWCRISLGHGTVAGAPPENLTGGRRGVPARGGGGGAGVVLASRAMGAGPLSPSVQHTTPLGTCSFHPP